MSPLCAKLRIMTGSVYRNVSGYNFKPDAAEISLRTTVPALSMAGIIRTEMS